MSQLAKVTGYNREHLGKALKPFLIGGKIRLREFDRIMDKRQDEIETALRTFTQPPRDALRPEDDDRIQRRVDEMFYRARRSKDRRCD